MWACDDGCGLAMIIILLCRCFQVHCATTDKWIRMETLFPFGVRCCNSDAIEEWETTVSLPMRCDDLCQMFPIGDLSTDDIDDQCLELHGATGGTEDDPLDDALKSQEVDLLATGQSNNQGTHGVNGVNNDCDKTSGRRQRPLQKEGNHSDNDPCRISISIQPLYISLAETVDLAH